MGFFLLNEDLLPPPPVSGPEHVPELVDDGDLLLRDIAPPLGEPRPCKDGRRPYDADLDTLHSAGEELQTFNIQLSVSHSKQRPSIFKSGLRCRLFKMAYSL